MERLIVKQWEAFYEFFCRMRFLHGFVYSFDPSGLAGIIREKIEINPREPRYLKVVWGLGYKIEKI